MATKRALHVLVPLGSREEAQAVRLALGDLGRLITVGTASAHMPGQRLEGDVVVVGAKPGTIDADAEGEVWQVDSLDDLPGLADRIAGRKKAPKPKAEESVTVAPAKVETRTGEVEIDDESEPEEEDEFSGMSRVDLIQEAARRWPGERRWVQMSNDDLLAAMRELAAED